MLDLTVVILTKNEELHIGRAIKNIQSIAKRIVIVDSYSNDKTKEIAIALGAEIFERKFKNYADQFQWALDNCEIDSKWIMRLDADEIIEDDLQEEIIKCLPLLDEKVVGINLKRKHIFWNRWIKHGGRYPLLLLRIWRNGHGRIENRWMDEHIVIWGGSTVTFDGGFSDWNLNDLGFFTDKHNKYATREALDILIRKYNLENFDEALNKDSSSFQAAIKRIMKERIYNKLPFIISTTSYFIWRYFFQLGFLDGKAGLVYHFLQGYWYRFLVGAKTAEYEEQIKNMNDKNQIKAQLQRITGHNLG